MKPTKCHRAPITREIALRVVKTFYPTNWEAALLPYREVVGMVYNPSSWLNAMLFVAAGGTRFWSLRAFKDIAERDMKLYSLEERSAAKRLTEAAPLSPIVLPPAWPLGRNQEKD